MSAGRNAGKTERDSVWTDSGCYTGAEEIHGNATGSRNADTITADPGFVIPVRPDPDYDILGERGKKKAHTLIGQE